MEKLPLFLFHVFIPLFLSSSDKTSLQTRPQLANKHPTKKERTALIDVYIPSISLAQVNRSVNRTVTLPAWLNAAASEKGMNFSQVLQDTLREKLNVD